MLWTRRSASCGRWAVGWPAPEDPDSGEDTVLGGRDNIAGAASISYREVFGDAFRR
jgi:hypothetical protein